MTNEELFAEIKEARKNLVLFNLRLGKMLQECEEAIGTSAPSDRSEDLMKACLKLSEDPLTGPRMKPLINAIHKAVYKHAQSTAEEEFRRQNQNLTALMPGCFKPKNKGKKEVLTVETTNEILDRNPYE